jgi:ankyrin repeat protein
MISTINETQVTGLSSIKSLDGFIDLHPSLIAIRSAAMPQIAPFSGSPDDLRRLIAANLTAEIERALAEGADINADDGAALQDAVEANKPAMVRLLLRVGADVHARQDRALRYASYTGLTSIVDILLAAGADVHARHEESLRWASARGHADVVALLLAAGAKPDVALPPDSDSYPTAPEWSRGDARAMAESYKQKQVVKVLDGALRPTFQGTFDL